MRKSRFEERMTELRGELKVLTSQLNSKEKSKQSLEEENQKLTKAIKINEKFVSEIISKKKNIIEDFINKSLEFLLNDSSIKCSIIQDEKPSGTFWYFSVKQGKVEGGIDTFGGGLMALISTLFRIILHIMTQKESFIILDESLNHLSSNYHSKLSELFKVISKKYNLSIILITHQEQFLNNAEINLVFDKVNGELKLIREERNNDARR